MLYLQVIWLSDMVSADGTQLLPIYLQGRRDETRLSTLLWPRMEHPTQWASWHQFLQRLFSGNKILQSVGEWVHHPHQEWSWFFDPTTDSLYHVKQEEVAKFTRLPSRLITQRAHHLFGSPVLVVDYDTSYQAHMLPATAIHHIDGSIFMLVTPTPFSNTPPPPGPTLWDSDQVPPASHNTPVFFQRLIGKDPPTQQNCKEIQEEILAKSLLVCSDGAFCHRSRRASHGWVMVSEIKGPIASGAGQDDGHLSLLSSYRSELRGILAAIYIIFCIRAHSGIRNGYVKIYCDNKGAITNAFQPVQPGISPYTTTDYDLFQAIKTILQVLPISMVGEWVKGHHSGRNRQIQHDLNDIADQLATDHMADLPAQFQTQLLPVPPPNFKV
jgi:hypothetical protein